MIALKTVKVAHELTFYTKITKYEAHKSFEHQIIYTLADMGIFSCKKRYSLNIYGSRRVTLATINPGSLNALRVKESYSTVPTSQHIFLQ